MQDARENRDQQPPDDRGQLVPAGNNGAVARTDYYATRGYPDYPDEGGDELAATLQQYIRLVLKRKWLILGVALMCLTLGGVATFMQTPMYTAKVRIQIDKEAQKVVEGGGTSPVEAGGREFLRTQYELLKSRAIAERIVSALQLENDKSFNEARNVSAIGAIRQLFASKADQDAASASDLQNNAVGVVAYNMGIRPVPGSRLVDLTYADPNPARAQRIANAHAAAYVASNLDKRFQANSYAKTFLEDQVKQLKIRLADSEKTLIEFAEREQIIQVTEKSSIAENNLAAANAALGQLISDRVKAEQLSLQIEGSDAINVPQLLSNRVIDGLRVNRNELTREYEEKLETFKPSYPAMVQIKNKMNEINRQLASEVKTIKSSLKASYDSALAQETEMKQRIVELRALVLDLQKRGIQYNSLKGEVETNRGLYNSLLQRYKEVDVASAVGTNNVFIVDKATKPSFPSSPRIVRALLLSLMLGLGAGLGLAYLFEILDDKVRAPEDVEQMFGLSTLGIIPALETKERFLEDFADPRSAVSEAYRSLATALQFSTESGLPNSIAITSAGPGEGKSTTSIAIARHFATMGMKVLLVDADLRKPSLHQKLDRDNSTGLSNYLTGSVSPPEVIQATDHANLAFMASGPLPPNAADLLGGTRMFSLISVGLEVFDLVVLDGPPLLGLADAQLVSSAASATVFVVGAGEQRKGAIKNALMRLRQSKTNLVGAVLTKFDAKTAGYGYGYGYGYGAEAYTYGRSSAPLEPSVQEPRLASPSVS